MKRTLSLVAVLALVPIAAHAGDATYELLSAPHIKGVLRIQVAADGKSLEYRKGSRRDEEDLDSFKALKESMAFAVEGQFDLAFKDFNPFLYSVSSGTQLAADPNFTALSTFIDRAEKVSGAAVSRPGGSAMLLPSSTFLGVGLGLGSNSMQENQPRFDDRMEERALRSTTREIGDAVEHLQDIDMQVQQVQSGACTGPLAQDGSYLTALKKVEQNLSSPILGADTLNEWIDEAYGAAGVQRAKNGVERTIAALSENIKILEEAHDTIDKATKEIEEFKGEACKNERIALLAHILRIMQDLDAVKSARYELKQELIDLSLYLAPYTDVKSWRENRDKDYIFFKPESDFEHVLTVNIAIKARTFKFSNGSFKIDEGAAIESSIRLRRYTKVVVEAGAALAYVDINFPVYDVGVSESGQTIVKRTKTDKNPIKGGLMLNMITRWGADRLIYPGFQLGVTQVDDYPGFFAGFVARFTLPRPLALSAGCLLTWYKDLDTLKENGPVRDAVALADDLKLKLATPRFYFAAQYTF